MTRPFRTRARIVRAGHYTTLVALPDWYGGQILAPVDTLTLLEATGWNLEDLPGEQLWVTAQLTAATSGGLGLRDWSTYEKPNVPRRRKAAPPSGDDGAAGVVAPQTALGRTVSPIRAA